MKDRNSELFRCFKDLCLFEYCINPLKKISLHDYEKSLKRLSCVDEYLTVKQV